MSVSRRNFLVGTSAVIASTAVGGSSAFSSPSPGWQMPPKRPFRTVENEWITLKDGTRLAARLWIPLHAATSPVPVVWEYLPYR